RVRRHWCVSTEYRGAPLAKPSPSWKEPGSWSPCTVRGGSSPRAETARVSLAHVGHVHWARELARELLEGPLPRRWAHSQGVAEQARSLRSMLGDDADLVESSAWLHDIGYSPDLAATGFHPLDGARYLRAVQGADEPLVSLVAYHSC